MEPTFTHNCHHKRPVICPACAQQAIMTNVRVQEQSLRDELLVMYLRQENGPGIVHSILCGTPKGRKLYEDIKTQAGRLA